MTRWPERYLFVFPALLLLLSILLADLHGPYFLGSNLDPAYPYLLNSLNLLTFHIPGHTDHPGTTLQTAGALIVLVRWLGSSVLGTWNSLQHSVLSKPEDYLHFVNLVLNAALAVCMYFAGRCMYRASGSVAAALILQGGCLLFRQIVLVMVRVTPEPLLVIAGFLLAIPLTLYIYRRDPNSGTVELPYEDRRYAICAGAIVAFGVVTKVTFAPFVLFALLFRTTRSKWSFCTSAILTAAILLIPVYPQIPRMVAWFEGLLLYQGRYGTGPKGILPLKIFADNVQTVFRSEPLVFVLPLYYMAALAVGRWGRVSEAPPHISILKRFIILSSTGIVLGLALTSKSPVGLWEHYLVPALVFAVLGNAAVALFIRNGGLSTIGRSTLLLIGVCLGAWGVYHSSSRLVTDVRYHLPNYRKEVRAIQLQLADLPNCTTIGYYGSSLPSYALFFANDYSAGGQSSVLAELYPQAIQYDVWSDRFTRFDKPVKLAELRESVGSGECFLMQGQAKLNKMHFKGLQGLLLEPVVEGTRPGRVGFYTHREGLYRLRKNPDFRPLIPN